MKTEIKKLLIENKLFSILFKKQIKCFVIENKYRNEQIFLIKTYYNNNNDNNMFFDKQLNKFINEIQLYFESYLFEVDLQINCLYYSNGLIITLVTQIHEDENN